MGTRQAEFHTAYAPEGQALSAYLRGSEVLTIGSFLVTPAT
jgi:hypothetical protein